jgi:16S rRNA (cytidine1402-2'-O)-methyltransferase
MLYIVATPIGNLEDITFRAVRVLKEADLILCEDSRVTKKLLDRYEVKTPYSVFHANTADKKIDDYLNALELGKNIALVTDAGTPGISDPGVLLVMKVKEKFGNSIPVVPIPGASALTTLVSAAGLPMHEFTYVGFLPQKKGREKLIAEISESKRPTVLFESPHRVLKLMQSLDKLGVGKVTIGRELTKIYEEIFDETPKNLIDKYSKNPPKGEFAIIIHTQK